jgi:cytochrome c553
MTGQAMALSDDDMSNLAVYFESLPAAAQAVADEGLIERGQALYRGGNKDKGTAACMACHGPTGRGNPAGQVPALRGQHAKYTAKQLRDYASGARTTDGKTHMMRDIAATLDKTANLNKDKNDIAALSSYVQGLK